MSVIENTHTAHYGSKILSDSASEYLLWPLWLSVSSLFTWLLTVGVKPTYSNVQFASQLLSQTTGHPTEKSSLWLDKHLHKREEISEEHNPALPSVQMAYFRKSIHGHFVVKTERKRKSMREKTIQG